MNRVDDLKVPKRRQSKLLVEVVNSETVVYDLDNREVHCLNSLSSLVWNLCDGRLSVREMREAVGRQYPEANDPGTILAVVQRLSHIKLLQQEWKGMEAADSISRRAMVKRLGKAAAFAAPLITTVVAPVPAQAGSLLASGSPCSSSAQCNSGICFQGKCL